MHKLYYHLAKAVLFMNTAVVGVGLFVYGEYTQVSDTLYCICGVEVLPKVTFMPRGGSRGRQNSHATNVNISNYNNSPVSIIMQR
jgi:hypothetical protein